MALPVSPQFVETLGALSPELFDLPHQAALDAFVLEAILDGDAWMAAHMGANYNLLTPPWAARLQARGQAMLALEYITDTLKAKRTYGTHNAYVSEDSAQYQALIDTNWGERALVALDIWVTVELGYQRAFALPLLVEAAGMNAWDKIRDPTFPGVNAQYGSELDEARGLSDPDVSIVRR